MKLLKEIGFRCFILLVMLSLAFVAYDMSRPVVQSNEVILAQDIVQCLVQPFQKVLRYQSADLLDLPDHYNFALNILLPIVVYMASIGGFMYLLIEDFKILKTFSRQDKAARYLWSIWIAILVCMAFIPLLFGFQLICKGLIIGVIATLVFLVLIGILYRLSYKTKK